MQRFTRAPAGWRMEHPAHPPPPSRGQRPTRCRGDHRPRTRGQGSLRPTPGLLNERRDTPPPKPPNCEGTGDTSQQGGQDASSPRADAEMTETSGPQESADQLPAATTCSVPQQQEPSTEGVPRGHPGTTSGHPSPTNAALDQDRVTMPP